MRRKLLKFLVALLVLLTVLTVLFWLWTWYQFDLRWQFVTGGVQFDPVARVLVSQPSAAGYGLAAAFFLALSLLLLVLAYRLLRR